MTGEEADRQLIEGLRRDDRRALADAYDAFGGVAYALAVRVLGSSSEAEDVVQEAFIALWRQAERLDPERGLKSYLLTIVHNKAIDRLRRRGRRAEINLDLDIPLPAPDSDDPQTLAARSAEREMVRAAVVGLGEEQRRTVELTYFGGLTINQVADRMGVPIGTAKSRLRLALGHLRRHLMERS